MDWQVLNPLFILDVFNSGCFLKVKNVFVVGSVGVAAQRSATHTDSVQYIKSDAVLWWCFLFVFFFPPPPILL